MIAGRIWPVDLVFDATELDRCRQLCSYAELKYLLQILTNFIELAQPRPRAFTSFMEQMYASSWPKPLKPVFLNLFWVNGTPLSNFLWYLGFLIGRTKCDKRYLSSAKRELRNIELTLCKNIAPYFVCQKWCHDSNIQKVWTVFFRGSNMAYL